jgi:hypothetical protein
VQNFSTNATWTLQTATPGTYSVRVAVRVGATGGAQATSAPVAFTFDPVVVGPATGVTLTPSAPSPHVQGTEVLWTAAASGSTGYLYQFWISSGGTWQVVQPYSTSATWTMPSSQPVGTYSVAVWVRTASTVGSFDKQAIVSYQIATGVVPPATGVTLTPSLPSPLTQGAEVIWTAAGSGSTGYQYQFWVNTGGTWSIVQPYSTTATWTMPASQPAGTYSVAVWVRTASTLGSFDKQAIVNYQIVGAPVPPATGVTLTPSQASPLTQGTEVIWTAAGSGSTGYQYQFWINVGGTWQVVQPYSATTTWTMPTSQPAGTYTVAVWVRTASTVSSFDTQALVNYVIQ